MIAEGDLARNAAHAHAAPTEGGTPTRRPRRGHVNGRLEGSGSISEISVGVVGRVAPRVGGRSRDLEVVGWLDASGMQRRNFPRARCAVRAAIKCWK